MGTAPEFSFEALYGTSVLTNIVDCEPGSVTIGDRVRVVFHDTASGHALPRFRPLPGHNGASDGSVRHDHGHVPSVS